MVQVPLATPTPVTATLTPTLPQATTSVPGKKYFFILLRSFKLGNTYQKKLRRCSSNCHAYNWLSLFELVQWLAKSIDTNTINLAHNWHRTLVHPEFFDDPGCPSYRFFPFYVSLLQRFSATLPSSTLTAVPPVAAGMPATPSYTSPGMYTFEPGWLNCSTDFIQN